MRQRNDNGLAADTVIEASETAETEVAPKTVVNLVVASGRVTLTDVTGWTMEAAQAELERIGLTPSPVELTDCPASDATDGRLDVGRAGRCRDRFDGRTALLRRGGGLTPTRAGPCQRMQAFRSCDGVVVAAHLQPVREKSVPALGEHALGVELHADHRQRRGAAVPSRCRCRYAR